MVSAASKVVVQVGEGGDAERARVLAERLGVPFVGAACETTRSIDAAREGSGEAMCDADADCKVACAVDDVREKACGADPLDVPRLTLRLDAKGLVLTDGALDLRGDFTRMLTRIRPGMVQRELVVRAAKVKRPAAAYPAAAHSAARPAAARSANARPAVPSRPLAIDATAGLGEDSLLLAAAGFEVVLYEHNSAIAALLEDALRRAAQEPELSDAVSHMRLVEGDSVAALTLMADAVHVPDAFELPLAAKAREEAQLFVSDRSPDVVLLDPMFPERRKSASVKKKLQMLQQLEVPCVDESALLNAALAARPRKIVIKRPPKGPYLAGAKPSYSLSGKAVRYDCIALPQ